MDQFQIGPVGGNGGSPFEHYDIPDDARLIAIHIYTEWVINAIKFDYAYTDGALSGNPPIGGLGGEHHVFYLDEDEYLTGISGRAGWYIDSIRFHTNKRVSTSYGGVGGDRDFEFLAPSGYSVSGLFGRSAWYLDALGVTVRRQAETPSADIGDDDEEYESWLELAGEGEPLPASVVVRREVISSNEALDELEDAALAEAISGMGEEIGDEEGTVDASVYTQVIDDKDSGQQIAVVMAVAAEVGKVETVGDDPDEVAVMVTDAIASDDEIALLEEEAVEGAIDTLLEEMGDEAEDVEVTIYTGITEDKKTGQSYGAVVAIATRMQAAAGDLTRGSSTVKSGTREPRSKELELVEGIGPKIAELLIEHGIFDLADLAAAPVDRLREILGAAGRRFRLADPGTWPEQAALGAAGLWDALTELQTRLKSGR